MRDFEVHVKTIRDGLDVYAISDITQFIGVGRENAITREMLRVRTGLPDRTVRRLIEEARQEGVLIINSQDGKGYYLSEDVGELKRQFKRNRNRAMSILVQQKHLRRKIKELGGDINETG